MLANDIAGSMSKWHYVHCYQQLEYEVIKTMKKNEHNQPLRQQQLHRENFVCFFIPRELLPHSAYFIFFHVDMGLDALLSTHFVLLF